MKVEHGASRFALGLESVPSQQLAFQRGKEALGHGVVEGVADRAHSSIQFAWFGFTTTGWRSGSSRSGSTGRVSSAITRTCRRFIVRWLLFCRVGRLNGTPARWQAGRRKARHPAEEAHG